MLSCMLLMLRMPSPVSIVAPTSGLPPGQVPASAKCRVPHSCAPKQAGEGKAIRCLLSPKSASHVSTGMLQSMSYALVAATQDS